MASYVYLPPNSNYEPVYRIDEGYYGVTTMKPSNYKRWDEEVLFGIPINLNRSWETHPILVETTHGGFIVETNDDGRLTFGLPSTKRALDSPIIRLHLMVLPDRDADQPDPTGLVILRSLLKFGFSLNEYLGIRSIKETTIKVPFENTIIMWNNRHLHDVEKIVTFGDPKRYQKTNIIISITNTANEVCGTIGRFNHKTGKYHRSSVMIMKEFQEETREK